MKKVFKIFLYTLLGLVVLIVIGLSYLYVSSSIASKRNMGQLGPEAATLLVDSLSFRDLNKNGKLDVYEDYREHTDARVEDLMSQMNLEEKAGLMFITMTPIGNDGELSETKSITNPLSFAFLANSEMVVKKKMNHFNTLQSPEPKALVVWNNNIQKLAERMRLGIPVTHATPMRIAQIQVRIC